MTRSNRLLWIGAANIDGVFVVELEHHGTQIMSLKVEP